MRTWHVMPEVVEAVVAQVIPIVLRGLQEGVDFYPEILARFQPEYKEHAKRAACYLGCAWCCFLKVDVNPWEVFILHRVIREHQYKDWLWDRISKADKVVRGLDSEDRADLRRVCPLVIRKETYDRNPICAVYGWRPLTCRAYHSFDAKACARDYRSGFDGSVDIEYSSVVENVMGAIGTGMKMAFESLALDGRSVELIAALKDILPYDNPKGMWMQGEDIFRGATANNSFELVDGSDPRVREIHLS